MPSVIKVINKNGKVLSSSEILYDNLTFGNFSRGNATSLKTLKDLDTGEYIRKLFDYNEAGLVTRETDALGNATFSEFDSYYINKTRSTNALGHEVNLTYDYFLNKPIRIIYPNNYIEVIKYDALGRGVLFEASDPSNLNVLITKKAVAYNDSIGNLGQTIKSYIEANKFISYYSYFDYLGRKVQNTSKTEDRENCKNCFVVVDSSYDSRGQKNIYSLPYLLIGEARSNMTTENYLLLYIVYDELGRVIEEKNILGNTKIIYDVLSKTVIDANLNKKDFESDIYGNLISVTEYNSFEGALIPYKTFYNYDYAGRLIGYTDSMGNIRSFEYDVEGNRLLATDLHAPNDSTFGSYWGLTVLF